jgi:DNA helicase HerA-like ATPase
MVVLVSPSYYQQRKAFYGNYCTVKPLLFRWSTLSADHIIKIMRVKPDDNQLYVAQLLNLLRSYQRQGIVPDFNAFMTEVQSMCNLKMQTGPLEQRIRLLSSLVLESTINASLQSVADDVLHSCRSGMLVVVDMTDPLLSSEEVNGIFQVLVEQFRALPVSTSNCGKLLAVDEAHKFMSGDSSDGLSEAIVNIARLMRHDGMRLIVSTQSPKALVPELLELVTVAALHR